MNLILYCAWKAFCDAFFLERISKSSSCLVHILPIFFIFTKIFCSQELSQERNSKSHRTCFTCMPVFKLFPKSYMPTLKYPYSIIQTLVIAATNYSAYKMKGMYCMTDTKPISVQLETALASINDAKRIRHNCTLNIILHDLLINLSTQKNHLVSIPQNIWSLFIGFFIFLSPGIFCIKSAKNSI